MPDVLWREGDLYTASTANVFGHSYRDNDYLTILSMQLIHRNKGEDKKNP